MSVQVTIAAIPGEHAPLSPHTDAPGPGAAPERPHQILDRTCALPRTMMSTTARSKKFVVV